MSDSSSPMEDVSSSSIHDPSDENQNQTVHSTSTSPPSPSSPSDDLITPIKSESHHDHNNENDDDNIYGSSSSSSSSIPSDILSSASSGLKKRRVIEFDEGEEENQNTKNITAASSSSLSSTDKDKHNSRPQMSLSHNLSSHADSDDTKINMEMLKVYYSRLFPCSLMMSWMIPTGANHVTDVKFREFSFTLQDDIYIRYLSFSNKKEFQDALIHRCPIKIDLGATYNVSPSQHTSVATFHPEQKELVFDIDMTDYNDVRTCCTEAEICPKCWMMMKAAVKVIDCILREDFGFKFIMWVYSGRRGIHCWVCDPRAKKMSNDLRTSVVEYLSVYMGKEGGKDGKKINISYPLHPTLQQAYETLIPYWEEQLDEQGYLDTLEGCGKILEFIDSSVRNEFLFTGGEGVSGKERWEQLKKKLQTFNNRQTIKRTAAPQAVMSTRSALHRIVFSHVYPRLDVNVSKQMNHLLKAPFCVHPKTGRVCVPFDASTSDDFNPFGVPTLNQLERELHSYTGSDPNAAWMDTSLRGPLEFFRNFVKELRIEELQLKEKRIQKEKEMMMMEGNGNGNTGVTDW